MTRREDSGFARRLLTGTCLATMFILSQPVLAQSAAAPAEDAAEDDNRLTEIVVTARFVQENIQDTPIAITAQTSAQLEAANVSNVSTLGSVIPNLQTVPGDSQSAGTPRISLRGVQQGVSSSLAVPPAIAIYTDDIYHATTAGSELDFTDIDRLEVNRGPQSTLSGNASIGGSIKLYTVDPKGDGSGYIQVVGGSRKKMGISGALDIGLTDTLSVRASGNFERQDGFAKRLDFACMMDKLGTPALKGTLPYFQPDSAAKDCEIGKLGGGTFAVGQIKLRWKPTDGIDIILTARHREEDLEETPEVTLGLNAGCVSAVVGGFPGVGPQPCTATAGAQAYHRAAFNTFGIVSDNRFVVPTRDGRPYTGLATEQIYDTYATNCRPLLNTTGATFPVGYPFGLCYDQGKTAHHTLLSGKIHAKLSDNVNMTAIAGYTDYANEFTQNGDQGPLGYVLTHFINKDEQYSGELRFDGKLFDDKLQWVLGTFALKMDGYQNNLVTFINVYQKNSVHGVNNSKSAFAHLDYNITDAWRVSGGGRYTDTKIDITIDNPQAVSVLVPIRSAQKRWDWLISTDYKVTDDVMLYVSAASGSRPPGLTTILSTVRQLAATSEEDLISYELGIKADLLDRRLRTNLTAFYLDYNKLSTGVTGVECRNQPGTVATWFNIAQNNVDALGPNYCGQFPGLPDPITWVQNVGIPAKVKGFEWDITALPIDGLRIDWTGGYNKFTSGVTTPNAPGSLAPGNHRQSEWNMHANISYDVETGIGTFTPRLDWNWQSQQDYDTTPQTGLPAPQFIIPAYSLWNAQLAYTAPDGNWTAALSVTNLADKWYHYQVFQGSINAQTRVAPPREFSLTVRKKF